MRPYLSFLALLSMVGGFVALQVTRESSRHVVEVAEDGGAAAAGADGGGAARPDGGRGAAAKNDNKSSSKSVAEPKRAPVPAARPDAGASPDRGGPTPDARPAPLLDRPLRVVSLGWELITPGVVANDGATPGKASRFSAARLPVHLSAMTAAEEVEAALARGGADPMGADVALLPLPTLVASYERLRALRPEAFFVVAFSRGGLGLMARPGASLLDLPRGKRVSVVGYRGSPAALLALFMLDLAGLPPERVQVVPPNHKDAPRAPFAARTRPLPAGLQGDERRFLVTTADAGMLVPMVAVAPGGFAADHRDALVALCRVWLGGLTDMHKDVPAAARRVAGLKGAPHALDLLKRLGQLEPATLRDNAAAFGLSGRGAATLDRLLRRTWRLFRGAGVVTAPQPDAPPQTTAPLVTLARTTPGLVEQMPVAPDTGAAAADDHKPAAGTYDPLVRVALDLKTWDRSAVVAELGFLAGVFHTARLQLAGRASAKELEAAVEEARARFGLDRPTRLEVTRKRPRTAAQVGILVRQ